ncbi:Sterigmatocystin 8-O-methyltransferase [Fusarium austroafricanum]|uniref:Sterigmatocystin 8-O-methyltransferase n=1 Tax=Fusarium austroafricanum TaxID=2364996 RepID=A0A8H4KFX2_9HYPO|nr:Sterigmatocystin 8-O-methyltransferase [Fusarium austroafricanum]
MSLLKYSLLTRSMSKENPDIIGSNHVLGLLDNFEQTGPNGQHACIIFKAMGPDLSRYRSYLPRWSFSMTPVRSFIAANIKPQNISIETAEINDMFEHAPSDVFTPQFPPLDLPNDYYMRSEQISFAEEDLSTSVDISVRLADFERWPSSASWFDKHLTEWIQPPMLRASEVILGAQWDYKVDIWNLGQIMTAIRGPFPKALLERSRFSDKYFDVNGQLAGGPTFVSRSLEKLNRNSNIADDEKAEFEDFVETEDLTPVADEFQTEASNSLEMRNIVYLWLFNLTFRPFTMATSLLEALATNGKLFTETGDENARQKIIATASALIQELENPGEQLARIGWGEPTRTAAFRTLFDLGILQKLGEEPQSSEQLAAGTKADTVLVARALKHLAANGIIKEVEQNQYVGTPFSMSTRDPTMEGGLIYSFEGMIPTFQGLPEFLAKTNYQVPKDANDSPVQYGLRTDKPFFSILRDNARLGKAFNGFMAGYAKARPRWVEFYPYNERLAEPKPEAPWLVDVGGSLGHEILSLASVDASPPRRLVLQDLPTVIEEAKASGNLPKTIEAVPHDFFTPQPAEYRGAQAYFMRLILHDWPDAECATILSHLRDAMVKDYSRLLINETVLRDVGAPWQQTSLDWTMMGMLVNRERTESQWRRLLEDSGLKITGIFHKGSESVIEAMLA